MVVAVFVVVVINVALFAALGGWAVWAARREGSDRIRPLLWVMAAVAGAFALSALTRLVLVAARLDLVPGPVDALVGSGWVLAQALLASALGVIASLVLRRVGGSLSRAERVASTLSKRLVDGLTIEELDLTRRQNEVVRLIGDGVVSDRALAEALVISPATAGTHVRDVLRKAGMNDRRELALLTMAPE